MHLILYTLKETVQLIWFFTYVQQKIKKKQETKYENNLFRFLSNTL